jgi:uncharacterized protein YndB with AHSA1/START domain
MTEEARADTRITGTLQSVAGKGVVRMEGRYETDINDLWSAITKAQRLARWIAAVDGDLRLGGAFRATFRPSLRPCSSPTATGRGSWSRSVEFRWKNSPHTERLAGAP